MSKAFKVTVLILLSLSLQGGCVTTTPQLKPNLTQQTVVLSECLYSSQQLYTALVKHKGEVELSPDCDYLSVGTARQIAKLP